MSYSCVQTLNTTRYLRNRHWASLWSHHGGHSDAPSTSIHISVFSAWTAKVFLSFSSLLYFISAWNTFLTLPSHAFSTGLFSSACVPAQAQSLLFPALLFCPPHPPHWPALLSFYFHSAGCFYTVHNLYSVVHCCVTVCFCLLEHRLPESGHLSILCTEVSACLPQRGV